MKILKSNSCRCFPDSYRSGPRQRLTLTLNVNIELRTLPHKRFPAQHGSLFLIGPRSKEGSRSSIGLIPVKIKHGSQRNQCDRDLLPETC